MGVVFDKLGFMRKLESGGDVTRPQAERLTDASGPVRNDGLARGERPELVLPPCRS